MNLVRAGLDIGVTFRTRTAEEVREINWWMIADLWPALNAGELRLPIDASYSLDDVADAFARMKQNVHFGKIVLNV